MSAVSFLMWVGVMVLCAGAFELGRFWERWFPKGKT